MIKNEQTRPDVLCSTSQVRSLAEHYEKLYEKLSAASNAEKHAEKYLHYAQALRNFAFIMEDSETHPEDYNPA